MEEEVGQGQSAVKRMPENFEGPSGVEFHMLEAVPCYNTAPSTRVQRCKS